MELPDGAYVPEWVKGAVFTWTEDDGTLLASVVVDATVIDGVPECTRIELTSAASPLSAALLARINPREMATSVLTLAGFVLTRTREGPYLAFGSKALAEQLDGLPRRRTITAARLAEVADAYGRGGIQTVVAECHVSRSQAHRLVAKAREARYLPGVPS